ncbi:MAG: hypothetical protein ACRC62_03710 [Microcoleus sp.]
MDNIEAWKSSLLPGIDEYAEISPFVKDQLEFLRNYQYLQQIRKTTLDLIKNTPRSDFVFSEPIDVALVAELALSQHLNTVVISRQEIPHFRFTRQGKKRIVFEVIRRSQDLKKLQGMQYDLIIINEPLDFAEYEINYIKLWNRSVEQTQRCLIVMFDSKREYREMPAIYVNFT